MLSITVKDRKRSLWIREMIKQQKKKWTVYKKNRASAALQ